MLKNKKALKEAKEVIEALSTTAVTQRGHVIDSTQRFIDWILNVTTFTEGKWKEI